MLVADPQWRNKVHVPSTSLNLIGACCSQFLQCLSEITEISIVAKSVTDLTLYCYGFYRMCKQCRSKSAGTSVPSDQDLDIYPVVHCYQTSLQFIANLVTFLFTLLFMLFAGNAIIDVI
jgi:hypothetical protein